VIGVMPKTAGMFLLPGSLEGIAEMENRLIKAGRTGIIRPKNFQKVG
jgi:hypothetical protein